MELKKNQNGEILTIELEGRLDTTTAPQLEAAVNEDLTGISTFILDFAKLEYISSAGLRVLLTAQKNMNKQGGKMTVKNVNGDIKEVLDITGFSDILTIE